MYFVFQPDTDKKPAAAKGLPATAVNLYKTLVLRLVGIYISGTEIPDSDKVDLNDRSITLKAYQTLKHHKVVYNTMRKDFIPLENNTAAKIHFQSAVENMLFILQSNLTRNVCMYCIYIYLANAECCPVFFCCCWSCLRRHHRDSRKLLIAAK